MENKKIKEHVKKRYGEIVTKECSSCSSSCCSTSSCGPPPQYVAWKIGYSPSDIESVPECARASENGYKNVEFRLGEIEALPVEDESVDVIISNCVINLAPDKLKVFREAYRILKPTGRLMVSDLVTEGELPEEVRSSFDAWAGCIAGALEKGDYLDKIKQAGFKNVKVVSQKPYTIEVTPELRGKIVSIQVEAYKSSQKV